MNSIIPVNVSRETSNKIAVLSANGEKEAYMNSKKVMDFINYAQQAAYESRNIWFGFHGATWMDLESMTKSLYKDEASRLYNSIEVQKTNGLSHFNAELIFLKGTSVYPVFPDFDFDLSLDSFNKSMDDAIRYGTYIVCLVYGDYMCYRPDRAGAILFCHDFEGCYLDEYQFFTRKDLENIRGGSTHEKK